jgi:hypothetical protein
MPRPDQSVNSSRSRRAGILNRCRLKGLHTELDTLPSLKMSGGMPHRPSLPGEPSCAFLQRELDYCYNVRDGFLLGLSAAEDAAQLYAKRIL